MSECHQRMALDDDDDDNRIMDGLCANLRGDKIAFIFSISSPMRALMTSKRSHFSIDRCPRRWRCVQWRGHENCIIYYEKCGRRRHILFFLLLNIKEFHEVNRGRGIKRRQETNEIIFSSLRICPSNSIVCSPRWIITIRLLRLQWMIRCFNYIAVFNIFYESVVKNKTAWKLYFDRFNRHLTFLSNSHRRLDVSVEKNIREIWKTMEGPKNCFAQIHSWFSGERKRSFR